VPRLGSLVEINPVEAAPSGPIDLIWLADIDALTATATPRTVPGAEEAGSARRVARPGDVLFARISPAMENGKVAIVPELRTGSALVGGELFVLRPKPGVDPRMIWAFLRQGSLRQHLRALMMGTTRLRLDSKTLARTELPALREWRGAETLEQLDRAVEARQSTTALLRSLPAAVATQAAAGLPRATFGALGISLRSGSRERPGEAGTVPVLRNPNLRDGIIDSRDLKYGVEHSQQDLLRFGDLLMVRSTGSREALASAAVYEDRPAGAGFASSLVLIRCQSPGTDFLWAWLQTEEVRAACLDLANRPSGRYNLTLGALFELPIPRLKAAEQDRLGAIAHELRLALAAADAQLEQLLAAIQAYLAHQFGGGQASPSAAVETAPVGEAWIPDRLRPIFRAASPEQRRTWKAVVRGESLHLEKLVSERERARLQHTLAILEQIGVVIREHRDGLETWHLPDAETELVD
jgi:type I restriction enzyme, S subunit